MLGDLETPDEIESFPEIDRFIQIVLLNQGRVPCFGDRERRAFQASHRDSFVLEIIEADSGAAADVEDGMRLEKLDREVENFLRKNRAHRHFFRAGEDRVVRYLAWRTWPPQAILDLDEELVAVMAHAIGQRFAGKTLLSVTRIRVSHIEVMDSSPLLRERDDLLPATWRKAALARPRAKTARG